MGQSRNVIVRKDGVTLAAAVRGAGQRVLLLHGGPGMSDYMDGVADELVDTYEVAQYQQRGLAPSSTAGPFTITDHVGDVARVLDELGWDTAVVVGHSWGGHLALHAATLLPDRVERLLCLDPLGGVGDGGLEAMGAEMERRMPPDVLTEMQTIERSIEEHGDEPAEELQLKALTLYWPAYSPSWSAAPAMPPIRLSAACYEGTFASIGSELKGLTSRLAGIRCPVGFVVGAGSPVPATASTDTAALIPNAWVQLVDGAGHFLWMDVPGCVRETLDRLMAA